jgi:hypothetical protein
MNFKNIKKENLKINNKLLFIAKYALSFIFNPENKIEQTFEMKEFQDLRLTSSLLTQKGHVIGRQNPMGDVSFSLSAFWRSIFFEATTCAVL